MPKSFQGAITVDIRGRPYRIAAEVTVETPEAEGVLYSQGGGFGRPQWPRACARRLAGAVRLQRWRAR